MLLLDLALQEVDSAEELHLSLDVLSVAEPPRVHVHLLELKIPLAAIEGTDEGDFLCEFGGLALDFVRSTQIAILVVVPALLALALDALLLLAIVASQ